jgi:hypothetical protein
VGLKATVSCLWCCDRCEGLQVDLRSSTCVGPDDLCRESSCMHTHGTDAVCWHLVCVQWQPRLGSHESSATTVVAAP